MSGEPFIIPMVEARNASTGSTGPDDDDNRKTSSSNIQGKVVQG